MLGSVATRLEDNKAARFQNKYFKLNKIEVNTLAS